MHFVLFLLVKHFAPHFVWKELYKVWFDYASPFITSALLSRCLALFLVFSFVFFFNCSLNIVNVFLCSFLHALPSLLNSAGDPFQNDPFAKQQSVVTGIYFVLVYAVIHMSILLLNPKQAENWITTHTHTQSGWHHSLFRLQQCH